MMASIIKGWTEVMARTLKVQLTRCCSRRVPPKTAVDSPPGSRPDASVESLEGRNINLNKNNSSTRETRKLRILQLNMRGSSVITDEIRQLQGDVGFDILMMQEPHSFRHKIPGFGHGVRIAHADEHLTGRSDNLGLKAGVAVFSRRMDIARVSQLCTRHCAVCEVQAPGFSFFIVSHYFQFRDDVEKHLSHLEKVLNVLRGKRVLIGLDSNANSPMWGPANSGKRIGYERGKAVERFVAQHGLHVLNDPNQPSTFCGPRGNSWIDVTLCTSNMLTHVRSWVVREGWTSSDHNVIDLSIEFEASENSEETWASGRLCFARADLKILDGQIKSLFEQEIKHMPVESGEDVERMASALSKGIIDACEASMPKRTAHKKSNPWWNSRLTWFKRQAYRLRRKMQRAKPEHKRQAKLTCRAHWLKYRSEIMKAKTKSWAKFVTEVGNAEPWGFVYKHQTKRLRTEKVLATLRTKNGHTSTMEETAKEFLDHLVPDDQLCDEGAAHAAVRLSSRTAPETEDDSDVTFTEVAKIIKRLKSGKAPGPDRVEVWMLKRAMPQLGGELVRLFNGCLRFGIFPEPWKEGSIRVLLKGEDKNQEEVRSYRPICLLSAIGKVFERVLLGRLQRTVYSPVMLSNRQFGFRQGMSTEDAIIELRKSLATHNETYVLALLFDITGAFDNVWWPLVLNGLKHRNCPKNIFNVLTDYFENRKVSIKFRRDMVSKTVSKGCPQGSVLGPVCWNIVFDEVLRILTHIVGEDNVVAYADDLLVLISGNTRKELEDRGQKVVNTLETWCGFAKLRLSEGKTEMIMVKHGACNRKKHTGNRNNIRYKSFNLSNKPPRIAIGNSTIKMKDCVKYLGLMLGRNMNMQPHCEYINAKLTNMFSKLARVAKSTWGLKGRALVTLYKGTFAPIAAYATAGWSDLLNGRNRGSLQRAQKQSLLTVTKAYRSVSWEALCVLAAAPPVDLLLVERCARYNLRKKNNIQVGGLTIRDFEINDESKRIIYNKLRSMWQEAWSATPYGSATKVFFANIEDRLKRKWVIPDHYTSQFLSGHGQIKSKLYERGLSDDDKCECGQKDTAKHIILDCPEYIPQREALSDLLSKEGGWLEKARTLISENAYPTFTAFAREVLWLRTPLF